MIKPTETINDFYQAIKAKNYEHIHGFYVKSDQTYVILEGPRYTTLGFPLIAKGWIDFCQSGLSLEAITWVEGPFEEAVTEMAWVAGMIILSVAVNEKVFSVQFRASFVLRNVEENWKIIHEHVSAPLDDPYGIGDWLKK
jgi:ketosteroid isomerase-like protein